MFVHSLDTIEKKNQTLLNTRKSVSFYFCCFLWLRYAMYLGKRQLVLMCIEQAHPIALSLSWNTHNFSVKTYILKIICFWNFALSDIAYDQLFPLQSHLNDFPKKSSMFIYIYNWKVQNSKNILFSICKVSNYFTMKTLKFYR